MIQLPAYKRFSFAASAGSSRTSVVTPYKECQ
jgi:hypothetical protein